MGGKSQSEPSSSKALSAIAKNLYLQTDPIRSALINRSANFLGVPETQSTPVGPPNITNTPEYDFLKSTIEKQYGQARQNAIGSTAPGGGLSRALTDIENARAGNLVSGKANLYDQEMNRAFSLATGTPLQTATSGLGQSGAIQAQIAQSNSSQNAAAKQGIGFGVGSQLGSKDAASKAGTAAVV